MAINFPGPYECRFIIATNEPAAIGLHQMRLSFESDTTITPGIGFASVTPNVRSGSPSSDTLDDYVETLLETIAPLYADSSVFGSVELWEYSPGTFDAIFRSAYSPTAAPTNTNPTIVASQTYFTWRTTLGGVMKLCLMGSAIAAAPGGKYPTSEAIVDDVFDLFTDSGAIWVGRDGGYALAPLTFLPGENEALWKKVNRS